MQIHKLFYETLVKIHGHAEDVARGIERGHENKNFEKGIALRNLADIQKQIKELEREKFEFDVHDGINIKEDLKRMNVAAVELLELVAKGLTREEEITRALIFHDALFQTAREALKWAKQYKDN